MGLRLIGAREMCRDVPGWNIISCKINQHCNTQIYKIRLSLRDSSPPFWRTVYESKGIRASIVSDPAHYLKTHSDSNQFDLSPSFREKVAEIPKDKGFAYLVIEQFGKVPETILDNGECYLTKSRDTELIALIRTSDGPWPEENQNCDTINVLKTSVKAELGFVSENLEEVLSKSCFVSSDGLGVEIYSMTSHGQITVRHGFSQDELASRTKRMASIAKWLTKHIGQPGIKKLVAVLNESFDKAAQPSTYVRIWGAMKDHEAAKTIGANPQWDNDNSTEGPAQKKHRNAISHAKVKEVDRKLLNSLQSDIFELLRDRIAEDQND